MPNIVGEWDFGGALPRTIPQPKSMPKIEYIQTRFIKAMIPARKGIKVLLLDLEDFESYTRDLECWALEEYYLNGEIYNTEIIGMFIGDGNSLIRVPDDESFIVYLDPHEDQLIYHEEIMRRISKLKNQKTIEDN